MALTLSLILTIFCIVVISYPLFHLPPSRKSRSEFKIPDAINSSKFIFQDIRHLKADLDIGAISDKEYSERLLQLRFLAASALRNEDPNASNKSQYGSL